MYIYITLHAQYQTLIQVISVVKVRVLDTDAQVAPATGVLRP